MRYARQTLKRRYGKERDRVERGVEVADVGQLIEGGLVTRFVFFFSSRRRHTRSKRDWSSDVCSSDLWNGRSLRMTRHHQAAVAALVAVLAASRAVAQQPTEQRRVDSLAAEVRALKARLDSMRAQLIHQPAAEPAADTSLAALRAAAAVAAGTDTTKMKADTAGPTKFVGRERSQPQLNPEISATGDVRAGARLEGIQRENFDPREFEVGLQSPLDPYSSTKIFVS